MKKISYTIFFLLFIISNFKVLSANEADIYKKIDLFSEVLEKINKEYVEDINQSDAMDAAINAAREWCNAQEIKNSIGEKSIGVQVKTTNGSWRTVCYTNASLQPA